MEESKAQKYRDRESIEFPLENRFKKRSSVELAGLLGITVPHIHLDQMDNPSFVLARESKQPKNPTYSLPDRTNSFQIRANIYEHHKIDQTHRNPLTTIRYDYSKSESVNESLNTTNEKRLVLQSQMPSRIRNRWLKVFRKLVIMNRVINSFLEVLADIHKYGISGKDYGKLDNPLFARLIGPQRRHVSSQSNYCIILPDSKGHWIWTIMILLLLVWTAMYLPYRLAFIDTISLSILIMETIIDSLFFIDIIINFLTAYYDDNVLITNHCKIAKNYLKTWFIIDLISCFPIQLIESDQKYSKALRLLRLPRLYKLLKFVRVVKILNFFNVDQIYEKFFLLLKLNSGIGRLLKVLITMGFFIHGFGCFWFLLAKLREFPPDCWIVKMGLLDASNAEKYVACFYWVLQTLTTVGYGDIPITGISERTCAIILMIFGVGFYSYTIGNLSSIFANIDARKTKLNTRILALNEFAYSIKMHPKLYMKIIQALTNNSAQGYSTFFNQDELLQELPSALRNEVLNVTHRKILNSFSFFKDKPPQFVIDILPKFKHLTLPQDEALYREGDYVEEVYFLLQGRVAFVTKDGYLFRNFVQGSYFGEIEIFKNEQFRSRSALTMTDVELLVIKKADLEKLLNEYPKIQGEMERIALQRGEKNVTAANIARKTLLKIEPNQISLVCGTPGAQGYNIYNSFFKENLSKSTLGDNSISSSSSNSSEIASENEISDSIIEENKETEEISDNLSVNEEYTSTVEIDEKKSSGNQSLAAKPERQNNIYKFTEIVHSKPVFLSAAKLSNRRNLINEQIAEEENFREDYRDQSKSSYYNSGSNFASIQSGESLIMNPADSVKLRFQRTMPLSGVISRTGIRPTQHKNILNTITNKQKLTSHIKFNSKLTKRNPNNKLDIILQISIWISERIPQLEKKISLLERKYVKHLGAIKW